MQTPRFHIVLSDEQAEWLRARAEREGGRSVTSMIREMVEQAMRQDKEAA